MLYYLLLLITASLLHTTSSTVYYVIPDDHYTTNNNTYTLQHYLNNTNKYFTSHTQLHFLPGQYYLNTDLIIQHVSNLSLIGNRTNEVINSVIKCTSPAGIVVVGSSNIVITNFVMNECGSNFNDSVIQRDIFMNNYQCRLSLLVLYSLTVTCNYFHSIWQYNSSGILFENGLGDTTLSNLISTYLTVRYGTSNNLMTNTTMATSTIYIDNFEAYNKIKHTYAVDIQQYQSNASVAVTLLNTKFKTELAIIIRCVGSLGHTTVTIDNCSFSSGEVTEYYPSQLNDLYNYDSNNVMGYGCNDYTDDAIIHYDSMVYSYFINHKTPTKTNIIQFINCSFININNSDIRKLIDFSQSCINADAKYLIISITNVLFYNNYYVQPISIVHIDNQFQNNFVSVFIKNVTVLSNVNGDIDAVIAHVVTLYIENVKFILNTCNEISSDIGSIIVAKSSYVQFSGYNEFSYNSAYLAIASSVVHLQEDSVLNFTSNTFDTIIYTDQPAIDDINMCAIQYISKRGNLDYEFQQGHKLNYNIIFTNNSINYVEISSYDLMHCAWDSSSAFVNSIPFQVNQRFIMSDNFTMKESRKLACLCDRNGTQHCNKGKIGPFYPGQTVSFHISLYDIIVTVDAARIEIRRGYSSYICDNDKLKLLQLQLHECKPLEYTIKHNGKWCELSLLATPL